jgi:hypothetical protein
VNSVKYEGTASYTAGNDVYTVTEDLYFEAKDPENFVFMSIPKKVEIAPTENNLNYYMSKQQYSHYTKEQMIEFLSRQRSYERKINQSEENGMFCTFDDLDYQNFVNLVEKWKDGQTGSMQKLSFEVCESFNAKYVS